MAVVINGSGTVTGLSVGGLPDGTVDAGTLATDSVIAAKLGTDSVTADALKDDAIAVGDLPAGSVLQVVYGTDTSTVYNATTTYADTNLTATITPSSTSSKILVITTSPSVYKSSTTAASYVFLRILRASTVIQTSTGIGYNNASHQQMSAISMTVLDSPATTSATIYKTQFACGDTNGAHSNLNGDLATIVLMEIGA